VSHLAPIKFLCSLEVSPGTNTTACPALQHSAAVLHRGGLEPSHDRSHHAVKPLAQVLCRASNHTSPPMQTAAAVT
jgi:hypothetical protein